MYYKTPINSETGKKFQALMVKRNVVNETINSFLIKIGATNYYYSERMVAGELEAVDTVTNAEGWRLIKSGNLRGKWKPDGKSKAGRVLEEEIRMLPSIKRKELDACVGFNSIFNHIGFLVEPIGDHFYFSVVSNKYEHDYTAPDDCIEIVESEYRHAEKECE